MFISHFPSLLPETTRMRCTTPSCRFKDVHTRHSTTFYSWIHADVISFLYTCTATTRNVHFHSSSSPPRFLLFLTPPRPLRRPIDSHITTWSARSSLSLTIHYIIINIQLFLVATLPRIKLHISYRHHPYSPSPSNMTYGVPQPRMTSMDLRVGGKYRIGKKIGSGSFGMSTCFMRIIH